VTTIQKTASESTTDRITMPIEGLSCGGGGALTVERAIARVPGVTRVYVNPLTEMAYIEFDNAVCSRDDLLAAIVVAGSHSRPSSRA
jgi:Cu+-exporting ATPase